MGRIFVGCRWGKHHRNKLHTIKHGWCELEQFGLWLYSRKRIRCCVERFHMASPWNECGRHIKYLLEFERYRMESHYNGCN
jgi:hypothetical protein